MRLKSVMIHSVLGALGGLLYAAVEILWRGYTHPSMIVVGGICFVLIGLLNEWFPRMPVPVQMAVGALEVTAVEFLSGCVLNLWLGLHIWDYSNVPGNVLGQVCLPFTVAWFFLAYVAIRAEDRLHKIIEN